MRLGQEVLNLDGSMIQTLFDVRKKQELIASYKSAGVKQLCINANIAEVRIETWESLAEVIKLSGIDHINFSSEDIFCMTFFKSILSFEPPVKKFSEFAMRVLPDIIKRSGVIIVSLNAQALKKCSAAELDLITDALKASGILQLNIIGQALDPQKAAKLQKSVKDEYPALKFMASKKQLITFLQDNKAEKIREIFGKYLDVKDPVDNLKRRFQLAKLISLLKRMQLKEEINNKALPAIDAVLQQSKPPCSLDQIKNIPLDFSGRLALNSTCKKSWREYQEQKNHEFAEFIEQLAQKIEAEILRAILQRSYYMQIMGSSHNVFIGEFTDQGQIESRQVTSPLLKDIFYFMDSEKRREVLHKIAVQQIVNHHTTNKELFAENGYVDIGKLIEIACSEDANMAILDLVKLTQQSSPHQISTVVQYSAELLRCRGLKGHAVFIKKLLTKQQINITDTNYIELLSAPAVTVKLMALAELLLTLNIAELDCRPFKTNFEFGEEYTSNFNEYETLKDLINILQLTKLSLHFTEIISDATRAEESQDRFPGVICNTTIEQLNFYGDKLKVHRFLTEVTPEQVISYLKTLNLSSVGFINFSLDKLDSDYLQIFNNSLTDLKLKKLKLKNVQLDKLDAERWQLFLDSLRHSTIACLELEGADINKLDEHKWPEFLEVVKNLRLVEVIIIGDGLSATRAEQLAKLNAGYYPEAPFMQSLQSFMDFINKNPEAAKKTLTNYLGAIETQTATDYFRKRLQIVRLLSLVERLHVDKSSIETVLNRHLETLRYDDVFANSLLFNRISSELDVASLVSFGSVSKNTRAHYQSLRNRQLGKLCKEELPAQLSAACLFICNPNRPNLEAFGEQLKLLLDDQERRVNFRNIVMQHALDLHPNILKDMQTKELKGLEITEIFALGAAYSGENKAIFSIDKINFAELSADQVNALCVVLKSLDQKTLSITNCTLSSASIGKVLVAAKVQTINLSGSFPDYEALQLSLSLALKHSQISHLILSFDDFELIASVATSLLRIKLWLRTSGMQQFTLQSTAEHEPEPELLEESQKFLNDIALINKKWQTPPLRNRCIGVFTKNPELEEEVNVEAALYIYEKSSDYQECQKEIQSIATKLGF